MTTRRIETQLTIKAVDQYSDALKSMRTVTGRFADGVRTELGNLQKMRGPLSLIEDFRTAQAKTDQARMAFERQKAEVRRLREEIGRTERPTLAMSRAFEQARGKAERLRSAHQRHLAGLRDMGGRLREAGIDTADLGGAQRRLADALDVATSAFGRQMDRMKRLETMQTRIGEARERMDRSLSTAANLSFVGDASMQTGRRILTGLLGPVRQAIDFETAMSDVRKVVDFDTPDAFRRMSDDILDLSTRIPMAADGLAQIVAAGGQSGIAREDLTRFAEMAAKIGVAFDISADHAGTSMASIQTAMGLTLDQTGALFDAMNHLSNNSAAKADQTLDFLNRAGADGATFGFDQTETLAFGAAMIAAGGQADTAATSFRNMGRALTRGESATDRQAAAMQKLGLKSAQIARDMQHDAVGTTAEVLSRLRDLPDHMQASVMSDLFGDEARELTKLINNAGLLPKLLSMVASEREYMGSAEAEYAARAETTANNLQLLRNQMARLGVSIGEVVLPPLNDLLEVSQGVIDKMTTWAKEHPKLTKGLVIGAAAVGGLAVAGGALLTAAAGLIGTMAVLRFGLVGVGARAAFAAGDLIGVGTAYRGLPRLPRFALSSLITAVRWTAQLLPAISWSGLIARSGKFGMNAAGWGRLITSLKWFARGSLRLIPAIGWAVMAAEIGLFAWKYLGLSKLPWSDWIPDIDWGRWFSFEWGDLLPVWSWDFIPELNLSDKISWFRSQAAPPRNDSPHAGWTMTPAAAAADVIVPPPIQARAAGGPVRAGHPYLVNETTPRSEWFVPSGSGGILNVSQAQSVFRSYLSGSASRPALRNPEMARLNRGAQGLRAAGLAVLTGSALAAPAAAQTARAGAVTVQIENFTVQVPSGVSDPEAIANLVSERIGQRVEAVISAGFSD
ncbi:phage tail tape measure protein [Paracoccus sp. (in: a-proteobacteria)]|uniref:phage tail tape measure protein n=1 Tax=Paracoccus sp. TaxID=267 RepID=UPI003A867645